VKVRLKMPWQKPKKSLTTSNQAYEFALKLLGNRDYSEQELRSRLLRRGATPEFCDQVVVKLKEYHLLDEQRYARKVYEAWLDKKVYGRLHLQAELVKKQVEPKYIPAILAQFTEEMEQERALAAYAVIAKRKDGKYDCTTEKGVAALLRYLTSRGFSVPALHHKVLAEA
jgi:regulatory protein